MIKKIFVIVFLILMFIPSVQMITGIIPLTDLNENRNKSKFPTYAFNELKTGEYTKNLEAYINDNFGFREMLVKTNSFIDINLLHSSSNDKVILGKDNYLFYSHTLNDYHRKKTMTDESIDNFSKQMLSLQNMLERKGIYFLFLVGPNKNSIYPEFMPFKSQNSQGSSNYDKLMKQLSLDNVNHLDLIPLLLKEKEKHNLYFKRDTHWNETAGFIVTKGILKKLENEFRTKYTPKITSFKDEWGGGWDLNVMLGVNKPHLYKTEYETPVVDYGIIEKKLPPTLWYHDSFSSAIKPHLMNYLTDLTYLYYVENRLNETLLNNLQGKKIVIYEVVERELPLIMNWDYNVGEFEYEEPKNANETAILDLGIPTSSYDVKINKIDEVFSIHSIGSDPRLYWKLPNEQFVESVTIKFEKSPITSTGQIFWTTSSDQEHNEMKSKLFEIDSSKKEYTIKTNNANLIDSIRIDLGMDTNLEYLIQSISYSYH